MAAMNAAITANNIAPTGMSERLAQSGLNGISKT
jgi:hypothetical protein